MKLYGYYRSSTSYRLRIALNLKEIAYEQIAVNLKAGAHHEEWFAAINPHKTVPSLMTGHQTLSQSLAILDWLEERHPDPTLLPKDLDAKQFCRELYYAVATEIHAANNLPVLKYISREFGADQTATEKWIASWVHRTFHPIEQRLREYNWSSENLPFGAPTFFETVLIPQIYNALRWNTDMSSFPNLMQIDKHCMTIDAFQRAHPSNQPDDPENI